MSAQWNAFTDPRPYLTVSGIAIDEHGNFPLLFRGPNVRSARNCWSLPSGLHEVGLSIQQQFATELKEELNLEAVPDACSFVGLYENIRPDGPDLPGWHWAIVVMIMRVRTLDTLTNSEPDKHPEILNVNYASDWISGRNWAPKLGEFLNGHSALIKARAAAVSKMNIDW